MKDTKQKSPINTEKQESYFTQKDKEDEMFSDGLLRGMERAEKERLAKNLVMDRIPGHRKGLPDVPTYTHSFRVYETINSYATDVGMSSDCCLAALLHDVVEDGGVSFERLLAEGFSHRTVELVKLCSHEETNLGKEARWTLMIAKLIEANDYEAWAIKLADLLDNLKESQWLAEDKRRFMIEVKAQLMLKLTAQMFKDHSLWQGLNEEYRNQRGLFEQQLKSAVNKEKEVSKEEFKMAYFKYGSEESGWGLSYWNHLLENEVGKRYFVREPATPEEASMMMTTDKDMHRMYFVTEGEVENFFDFPSA
ncbi:MAG: HD domain-containing protein [Patescibacteria group bacterium]